MAERTFYQDRWNERKIWEVVRLSGGFYLRQYIDGKQYGRGLRTTKRKIAGMGILEFDQVPCIEQKEENKIENNRNQKTF